MQIIKDNLIRFDFDPVLLNDFNEKFPNGCSLHTFLSEYALYPEEIMPIATFFCTPAEFQQGFLSDIFINTNCETIYASYNCGDSKNVINSNAISSSRWIFDSTQVEESTAVARSICVEQSEFVYDSSFVTKSMNIANSKNITDSCYIGNTIYADLSSNLMRCANITNSSELVLCSGIDDGHSCWKCEDSKHILFCSDISNTEYCIFNKQIAPETFNNIKRQYEKFFHKFIMRGFEWSNDPAIKSININNDIRTYYKTLSNICKQWITTLPHYSESSFYNILWSL